MSSPVVASDFVQQNFSGDVCEMLRKLMELNTTLKTWFDWAFDESGNATSEFKAQFQDLATPVGAVIWRPLDTSIPAGYLLCNGQAVSRMTYAALFAFYGTEFGAGDGVSTFNLPNLQARMLIGAGTSGVRTFSPKGTGGSTDHTLTIPQLPAHKHHGWDGSIRWNFAGATGNAGSYGDVDPTHVTDIETKETGGNEAHENMPPYFTGVWIVKY